MRVGVLFSGGKDSCLALHKFLEGNGKADCLLSIIPKNMDSFMFHAPDLRLLKKQAEMLKLPLVIQETEGEKEKEIDDLKKLIKKSKVDAIVIGGIESSYQGNRIKKLGEELGIKIIAPLWGYNSERLWGELLDSGFKVIITKIASEGIPKELIGEVIGSEDIIMLKKLSSRYKFRMDFEGGDAETAVLFMPEFSKEIVIEFYVVSEDKYRHFIKIKSIL